jgi:NitT/TauT family transport system substrate-binding protein
VAAAPPRASLVVGAALAEPGAAVAPETRAGVHGVDPAAAAPQLQTVRTGVVFASSEIGIYLAQERGYFAEQGLTADYVRFDSGAFAVAPLSVGDLEAASGVVSAALFNAINRGVEIRLVSPQSRYELGYSQQFAGVRKDLADSGAIRDYADLRGRTIGILSFGSTVEMIAERMLQRAGLTTNDVNLVQMGAADQVLALGNRAIDVGMLTEPQATQAADRGVAVKWREAAEWTPGIQVSNILYGPNFVSRNPDAGQRFMLAYLRGVRDYYNAIIAGRGDRESIIEVLIRQTPYKDRSLYDRILWVYIDPNLALVEDDLRATMQWFVAKGHLERPTDLSVAVDRRFVQHALGVLGPYQ